MTRPPLADQPARDTIAAALDETLVVEAAAGTGKTTELVRRIVEVLATDHAEVAQIVAVTFTEKAAGELKLRLRQALEFAREAGDHVSDARARLARALASLEDAHIGTIHGFCADLLHEYPVEAGVDPLFPVLTEPQARRRYADAFAVWLQEALEVALAGVRRALRRAGRPRLPGEPEADGPVDRLQRAGWDLVEWRDFHGSWTRSPFDRDGAVDALAARLREFAAATASPTSVRDPFFLDTAPARRAADDLRVMLSSRDCDGAEAVLVELRRNWNFRRARKGRGAGYASGLSRAEVQAFYQALVGALDAFAAEADAELAALLREELRGSIERYEASKREAGALDYLDLLLRARDLVRDHYDVRRASQARFRCFFVDEFQDTDPLQAEILLLLAADDPAERDWTRARVVPGKLFIVGDPKQSIYRFRRADVRVYYDVCQQLEGQGARILQLTTSFRSAPSIQRAINASFAPLMTGDSETLQARYVPLSAPGDRRDPDGQPSVLALPVPRPYGKLRVSGVAIDASLPDAVGAFVHWLLTESGWTVTERRRPGVPVRIAGRHVCILFRRFVSFRTDVTRSYMDALEARGIRHVLVGGRAFHDREEIETLRAALTAVEWPDDELSVFATLRGSLFAIGDEELLEYRHLPGVRGFRPFGAPDEMPAHLTPVRDALRLLATLHRGRNSRPMSETVTRLLVETRAHVGFALRNAGEQVLANVLHVGELARQYEQAGGISFRGFVDELQAASGDGQAAEAPVVEDGSDGVRLMTVHKAKGLEFPVVILADLTAKLAPTEASRHLDVARGVCAQRIGGWSPRELLEEQSIERVREQAEGVRLAYVAATRARDLLVLPAVGDQPFDGGWTGPLDAAIYPWQAARRHPTAAPGCPAFRKDSVLTRPNDEIATPDTVAPGLDRLEAGGADEAFGVVWWDPAELSLGVEAPFGLRREELIARDVEPEVVAAGQRAFLDWRESREAAIASGRRPSLMVQTVTEWAAGEDPLPSQGAVETVTLALAETRPRGPRFGTLVHEALAVVPLDANWGAVAAAVRVRARALAATADEAGSAIKVVTAVLSHPLFDEARYAANDGWCRRETPVTLRVGETLVEGVIDCAFATGGRTTVVDVKTDRAVGADLEAYRRQIGLYASAVARVTDGPVRAILLQV